MNILRRCDENGWIPRQAPDCHSTQHEFEKSEICPLNYTTISSNNVRLCVLLTKPKIWQNQCIYDGSSMTFYHLHENEKHELLNYLIEMNVTEVWLPGKRFTRFGPVIWTTAGELNGEQVEFDKINVELINENYVAADGCFSALINSSLHIGSIKNCKQKLNVLCVFRRNNDYTRLISTACPKNSFITSYYSSDQCCHSIQMIDKDDVKEFDDVEKLIKTKCKDDLFTMDSVEKTELFRQLSIVNNLRISDRCLFAVAPGTNFISSINDWKTKVNSINYVNWDVEIVNGSYLTTNKYGKWNWIDRHFDCLVCSSTLRMYVPELVLNFNRKKRRLYLTVYNENYVWHTIKSGVKCFTNADDELIRTVEIGRKKWSGALSIEQINRKTTNESRLHKTSKAIYELKLYGEGPGYYWCEGYTMLQFDMIQSTKVVAFRRERGEVFTMLFNTMCTECEQFFRKFFIKNVAKQLRDHLKDVYKMLKKNQFENMEFNIENVRIMQIEEISLKRHDLGMFKIRLLCHLTVSLSRFDEFDEYLRIIKMYDILKELLGYLTSDTDYEYVSLNSTEYCLPETNQMANGLSWINAKIGETIPSNELCLLSNGLPAVRRCVGDFLYGGIWQYQSQQKCHRTPDHLTEKLFELFNAKMSYNDDIYVMQNISMLLQKNPQNLNVVAADLFYLGRIMSDFSRINNKNSINNTFNLNDTEHIFSIYNNLMYLNENTTRKSAALNSTNILLDAFDNILNGIQIDITSVANNNHNNTIVVNSDDGTITTQTPNLIVYVIDPSIKNVSGVALIKKSKQQSNDESNHRSSGNDDDNDINNDDFTDYYIKTLYANQSSDELLNDDKLEIATFVPISLLNLLNQMANETEESVTSPIKIVITIYYNDRLFQEYKNTRWAKSTGRIISVLIPGYGPNLPSLLPTFMRSRNIPSNNGSSSMCGYWNFDVDYATWADDGCEFIEKSEHSVDPIMLCACSHLTHYSYLIVGTVLQSSNTEEYEFIITESHQKALDTITLLGCLLSLMGVCGITITAIFFRTWRKKPSSIVLIQLSAAIALQMVLLCFVNTEYSSLYLVMEQRFIVCVVLGALLQYSILVAFSWMLITAYLQFMRYVIVLGPQRSTRFFLKSFLIGWAIPLVPVLIVVIISPESYVQSVGHSNGGDGGGICYPSGTSLCFGLILPIGLIILANLIIFILVIYNILGGSSANIRSNKRTLVMAQLRLCVFLFFLLGLSWIFGFLASIKSGIIFSYLFCLTATIQGFVLFVYFIILDSNTRKLWRNLFCHKKR
ncbi:uncharacterized protein LOC116345864 [Contarinia nasturtii]|uniref:uncharacterized protein LOC116345864 n=1 Tax=Contarinia nasturtii TaxID=265458 RepID=UPI0012D4321B|nr:uncharacterized protein LOC116345864 [Contarinia nasturtii]